MDVLHVNCELVKEHVDCFQFGVITNKAVINIHVKVLGGYKFSSTWDK